MQQLAVDDNYREVQNRKGVPVGGLYEATIADANAGSSGTWYHLLPSHDNPDNTDATATAVTDTSVEFRSSKLNIANLRPDIQHVNLNGWNFDIQKPGYAGTYLIRSYASGIMTLESHEQREGVMKLNNIPGNIEYCIYPSLIFPLSVWVKGLGANTDSITVGYAEDPVNKPTEIVELACIENERSVEIPTTALHAIYFRLDNNQGGSAFEIAWGEQSFRR